MSGDASRLVIYTAEWCAVCLALRKLLEYRHIAYTEIDVTHYDNYKEFMYEKTGYWGTPGILLDGTPVRGGFPELAAMINSGMLDDLKTGTEGEKNNG